MEFRLDKDTQTVAHESISIRMNAWPDCYYSEMDPAVRRQLLDEANRMGLTPEDNKIREFLYNKRYRPNKDTYIDFYLRAWLEFKFADGGESGSFGLKRLRKNIRKQFSEMGEPEIRAMGPRAMEILYDEYKNCGLTYISLSVDDPSYCSIIFGFGTVSDDVLFSRIYRDFMIAAVTVPEKLDMKEELSVWTEAVKSALRTAYPRASI